MFCFIVISAFVPLVLNYLSVALSYSPYHTHITSSLAIYSLSLSITPSVFHRRLKMHLFIKSRHPNVQGPFYSTTCLPLQPHILPSTQSFAAFLQSVSPPSAQSKNRFWTSCFFLCCSSNLESYTCRH